VPRHFIGLDRSVNCRCRGGAGGDIGQESAAIDAGHGDPPARAGAEAYHTTPHGGTRLVLRLDTLDEVKQDGSGTIEETVTVGGEARPVARRHEGRLLRE